MGSNHSRYFKGTFEISRKIWNPYMVKYTFYWLLFLCTIYDIFKLWRHKPWWDGPQAGLLILEYNAREVNEEDN